MFYSRTIYCCSFKMCR